MKIITPRKTLHHIGLCLLSPVITTLLFTFIPYKIHYLYLFNWLALAITIYYLISTRGNQHITSNQQELKGLSIMQIGLRIMLVQICLLMIFIGIEKLLNFGSVIHIYSEQLTHYGLYPWPWVCIVCVAFSHYCKKNNTNTYSHHLVSSKKMAQNLIITAINAAPKLTLFMTWTITMLLICTMWAEIFTPKPYQLALGAHLSAVLTTLPLCLFSLCSPFKKITNKLFSFKTPRVPSILFSCISITIIFIVLSIITAPLTKHAVVIPSFLNTFLTVTPSTLNSLFCFSWWFGFSYITGIYIAHLARGYTIRSIILLVFTIPAILIILATLIIQPITIDNYTAYTLATMGFIGLSLIFMADDFLPAMTMCYLPAAKHPRYRNHTLLFRKYIQVLALIAYVFFTLGSAALSVILFASALLSVFYIPFILKYSITQAKN